MSSLDDLLILLNDWRHFPAYQLERRVDLFIGLLLPRVIASVFAPASDLTVIPEFPLHKGRLGASEREDNRTVNVDFAVFSKRPDRRVFLLELKTDAKSLREKQLSRMAQTRDVGLLNLLEGVREAGLASHEKRKYARLMWALHEAGCIDPGVRFKDLRMDERRPALAAHFRRLEFVEEWTTVTPELLLIVPTRDCTRALPRRIRQEFKIVDFADLADEVRGEGDVGAVLGRHLEVWGTHKAGYTSPWRNAGPEHSGQGRLSETAATDYPQLRLKGTVTEAGDIISPALPEDHWESNVR